MSNTEFPHNRVRLTNRYVERNGSPVIPISGEMHFSRVPRHRWLDRLRLMKSGGISVVASYIFWIHHEEEQGAPRFDDNLDVAAFVDLCAEMGLDVVLRLGPWCHGEVRNGGLPDWVRWSPVELRSDDPEYLAMVDAWFSALGEQLAGRCGPDSPIIGLQIENELYKRPEHILTLKRMAIAHGLTAPLWTATAWGGAELPEGEVMPLFGGYGDGFWVDADSPWDATFREHFFFSHVWDDPGIGADLRPGADEAAPSPRSPSEIFPAATCELGGGMATAYHRRPRPDALDIAAVANNKIGNGSAWQGYYMYVGGSNPRGTTPMQESHSTGYPNDLPQIDYDFHAPIGSSGRLAPSHAALRLQHAFLEAFGDALSEMPSDLPEVLPVGVDDSTTLRWAMRSDGTAAFVFVTWHQPHVTLAPYLDATFELTLGSESVIFPTAELTIPPGTIARWPVNLRVGDVVIRWATASPITLLEGATATLVLGAEPGIPVRIGLGSREQVTAVRSGTTTNESEIFIAVPTEPETFRVTTEDGTVKILVLPSSYTSRTWVLGEGVDRQLLLSDEPVWLSRNRVAGRSSGDLCLVSRYNASRSEFELVTRISSDFPPGTVEVDVEELLSARPASGNYGAFRGRASAPSSSDFSNFAARYLVGVPLPLPSDGSEMEIHWNGDAARLLVDGVMVADRFWDGSCWLLDMSALGIRDSSIVTLEILPLHPAAHINVQASLPDRDQIESRDGYSLPGVRIVNWVAWEEGN